MTDDVCTNDVAVPTAASCIFSHVAVCGKFLKVELLAFPNGCEQCYEVYQCVVYIPMQNILCYHK
jgi:hypothetical protein